MTPGCPQAFGVALMALWGTAGAVALVRATAKSPATRELLAAVRICPIPVVRVSGTGTVFSETAHLDFPTEAECCCSRPGLFTYARIVRMDSNLSFGSTESPDFWVDPLQCPDHAIVYATDESSG